MGAFCDGCDKIHLTMNMWDQEDRDKQIAHVKANNSEMCFNANSAKFLKNEDKYLLGNANGPLNLGKTRN